LEGERRRDVETNLGGGVDERKRRAETKTTTQTTVAH